MLSPPIAPLKLKSLSAGGWRGGLVITHQRSQVSVAHLQEVILNVAVEGSAQPHRVVLPPLVRLQVEAELRPAVLQLQAERRPHLEEHGGQLLDVEDICGGGRGGGRKGGALSSAWRNTASCFLGQVLFHYEDEEPGECPSGYRYVFKKEPQHAFVLSF